MDALEIARNVCECVRKSVCKIVGTEDANEVVGFGCDGTPTKKIDIIAESVALDILREYDVTVLTEESGIVGDGDVFVSLDPIDGTFNAVKGIPIYSTSICFSRSINFEDTFLGYVMNLATCDEYYSLNGKSYKNDRKIRVSNRKDLRNSNILFYYPTRSYPFKRVRILGSASLEICYVAEGVFDAFVDVRLKDGRGYLRSFDVCAGLFICKNAGARMSDHRGRELRNKSLSLDERFTLVVSNPHIHDEILRVIS